MAKGENTISANEINRFSYCQYQWYYDRIYSSKELRRLKKEYIEKPKSVKTVKSSKSNNNNNTTNKNFARGNSFHKDMHTMYTKKVMTIKIVSAVILVIAIIILLKV